MLQDAPQRQGRLLSRFCWPNTRVLSQGWVSLPDGAGEARDFTTSEACRLLAEEDGVQMLRGTVKAKQNLIDPGFSLYSDPIFKRERGKYVRFIELPRTRHLIRFGTWRREGRTQFFVCIKWRKRMGMNSDCRRSNLWFKRQPHVQLVTGGGLANLEVETDIDAGHDSARFLCLPLFQSHATV